LERSCDAVAVTQPWNRRSQSQVAHLTFAQVKLTEKIKWPLWHFLVAVVLSLVLTPAINASVSWMFLFHRICVAGYIIFAVLYFGGWLKTGRRIEWAICLACT